MSDMARTVREANRTYHDRAARQYESDASTIGMFTDATRRRVRDALELAATRSGRELLVDVGCGTGHVLSVAAGLFRHAVGFDISAGMRAVAAERGLVAWPADLYHLPLRDGCADAVTAFSVLHHLYDPGAVMAEAARVLKPGGLFYSDWDPSHEGKILDEHPLVRGAAWAARWILFGGRQLHHEGEETEEARLAEYHVYQGSQGFTLETMGAMAAAAGLRPLHLYAHSCAPALHDNRLARLPPLFLLQTLVKAAATLRLSYARLASYVLLVAEKPR